jgi:hypothetical protein
MRDIVERAKAALEGAYEGPWINVGGGNIHVDPVGTRPPIAKTWTRGNGDFIAASRALVAELVVEVERLSFLWEHSGDHMCGECWPPEPYGPERKE